MEQERYSVEVVMPGEPRHTVPRLACDCHGHIFPSREKYPTANPTMPLATVDLYVDVHRRIGIERGVLIQGGAYRHDNRAMLDALGQFPLLLRGVALVPPDIPFLQLEAMRAQGVRAVRFTAGYVSPVVDLPALAPKMRELQMHAELFIGTEVLQQNARSLLAHRIPLVFDHLGGPFADADDIGDPKFQLLLKVLRDEDAWLKLSPQRNSKAFPSYQDVRPFFDALVSARPDRLVWGSDWPFPNMGPHTPDPADLLDLLFDWIPDQDLQRRILVDNPQTLYGFPSQKCLDPNS